jgi:heterodisulfide reductase subunit A
MCSDPGQVLIGKDIKEHNLNRIIVAACSPRMHEPTFRKVLEESGLNEGFLEMVNIREQCSWVHLNEPEKATKKAKDLIRMAVARTRLLTALEKKEVKTKKSVLVIGGGISGINAALDLAEIGFKVYLVEKEQSIGGHMAQLDKTFPTMDCSICIEGPKMVDVSRHPNIELIVYGDVLNVEGYVGNFKVKIRKNPRYVIKDKCTGCGECSEVCPIEYPNEWDLNMGVRKAISTPFPQAVPLIYAINKDYCIECYKCVEICADRQAIDFSQKPEEMEIEVGAIIVAIGHEPYNPIKLGEFGFGKYENVVTSLELERLISAAGPTNGKIIRTSDNKEPKKIAFIQCVGSRDERIGHSYCSNTCCMNAIKQSVQIKEKHPETEIYIFYMDVRAFGKGFEQLYRKARGLWVNFTRGIPSEVTEDPKTKNLIIRVEDTFLGKLIEVEVDLLVLSIGQIPPSSLEELSKILHIPRDSEKFLLEAHPKLRPVDTHTAGIFLAGTCQGPKTIHDSVAQAKAAAASVAALLTKGKVKIESTVAVIDQDLCLGCGLCEEVCPYTAMVVNDGKSQITAALCRGCGVCASSCPERAIMMTHFTDEQVLAQIVSAYKR